MTEASFQAGRKLMQKANHWRVIITKAKGNVAKWTQIESSYRENMQEGKADGAKKIVLRAIEQLQEVRQKFAELKFPPNDLK